MNFLGAGIGWASMFSLVAARKSWQIALIAALWLAGCSAANRESLSPSLPAEHTKYRAPASGHVTVASWYGPGFIGQRTASGETYHEDDLTAASRSLPLATRVRVTNLDNGQSVIVRINDHGPFVRGRGIDLSERAARDIGLNHSGIARVSVTRLDATASAAAPTSLPLQWRGATRITHSTGPRYRVTRHTRYHYYRYASTSVYHRMRGIVADPVGDWLLRMVR